MEHGHGSLGHGSLVTLDLGARGNGLASLVHRLAVEHLQDGRRRRTLARLRAVVGLLATDASVAVTLSFRQGSLIVFDGLRADADVVIEGRGEELVSLALIGLVHGFPHLLDRRGRELVRLLGSGRLRIRGLLFHPLLVARLAHLLAVSP